MQKKKITKRQRKALHQNAMVKRSIRFGQKIKLATASYIGTNPVFKDLNANVSGKLPTFAKVRGGIPFARA